MRGLVDGMRIEAPIRVPGLAAPRTGCPDWSLTLERGAEGDGLDGVEWTGDVRAEGEPWARFGRLWGDHVVLLEETASLVASTRDRRAVIRHDGGARRDVTVLRRLSPYLASLSGRLTLHAAAVVLPAGAVLICGAAGAGKSTLARAFDGLGFPVLGDDHVVVRAPRGKPPVACASFPFVDVAVSGKPKASVPLRAKPRPASAPIAAVAFLSRGRRLARTPLRTADAVAVFLRETIFVADPADGAALAARLDDALGLLAAAPPVSLVVPDRLDLLAAAVPDIADALSICGGPA